MKTAVLSLCDFNGTWSAPYVADGCVVIRVDPKHTGVDLGQRGLAVSIEHEVTVNRMDDGGIALGMTAGALADLLETRGLYGLSALIGEPIEKVSGVLMAPPCTDFSVSGNQWWPAKDADGRTAASVQIVRDCLRVKDALPGCWWVLENPVGRIARLVPELGHWLMTFHPHEFAGFAPNPDDEAYTKKTCLWGSFNVNLERSNVEPVIITFTSKKTGKVYRGSKFWAGLGGKSERTKELRSAAPKGFSKAFHDANPACPPFRMALAPFAELDIDPSVIEGEFTVVAPGRINEGLALARAL